MYGKERTEITSHITTARDTEKSVFRGFSKGLKDEDENVTL